MAKLTDEQLRMLGTIDRGADLGWGRIHGREWFGTAFRGTFDWLLENGYIEPTTEYRPTDAGRAALAKNVEG